MIVDVTECRFLPKTAKSQTKKYACFRLLDVIFKIGTEGQKMFSFCFKFLHCRDDREQYCQKGIFFENSLNMLKNVRVAGKKK